MDKILLCYFSHNKRDYIPLDIGYALAKTRQAGDCPRTMEIASLSLYHSRHEDDPLDREVRKLLSYRPKGVIFFVENIQKSGVFAWKRTKDLATELKKINPNLVIGIQSYKASYAQMENVLQSGLIDFVMKANPEEALPELDKILTRGKISGVFCADSSLLAKDEDEQVKGIEQKANSAIASLDELPSPYLGGIFDEILEKKQKNKAGKFTAFLYTSRGCVFGCYYCWRSVKSERNVSFFSAKRVYDEIEYLWTKFNISSFFILDDAFPYSKARLKSFLSEFEIRKRNDPSLKEIRLLVMCRIEMLDQENISLLKELNVVWIQIGLQTINPALQHYMNRKVAIEKFGDISVWLNKLKIKYSLDVIAGLPGDSVMYFKKTMDFAIKLRPYGIQVNLLYINPGTLFSLKKNEYGIEISECERDCHIPSVTRSKGVDDKYISMAKRYVKNKIATNPEIKWYVRLDDGAD